MDLNAEHMEINDDMLINYLLNEADVNQVHQVEEWLKHPANEQRFNQYKLLWETSKTTVAYEAADALASLQRLKDKAANREIKVVSLLHNSWLKMAAAILIIAGAGWYFIMQQKIQQMQLATIASVKTDTLADGSVVTLNRNSMLQYPEKFTGSERNVVLARGEAFFNVTHNKLKPFIITAGSVTIKVVGTSFNVKNKNDDVEVIVETGIVQVSKNGNTIAVKPGERVLVAGTDAALAKEKTTDRLYNYYRSKEFVADDVPLWRMVQVLNEAYDSNIIIGRKELRDLPLNTTFKNDSLDNILEVIAHTFKLTLERKNNEVILK